MIWRGVHKAVILSDDRSLKPRIERIFGLFELQGIIVKSEFSLNDR